MDWKGGCGENRRERSGKKNKFQVWIAEGRKERSERKRSSARGVTN